MLSPKSPKHEKNKLSDDLHELQPLDFASYNPRSSQLHSQQGSVAILSPRLCPSPGYPAVRRVAATLNRMSHQSVTSSEYAAFILLFTDNTLWELCWTTCQQAIVVGAHRGLRAEAEMIPDVDIVCVSRPSTASKASAGTHPPSSIKRGRPPSRLRQEDSVEKLAL